MANEQNYKPLENGLKKDGEKNAVPQEQMQREVDYVRAQQILSSMFDKGLISLSEFNKITELNRKTFSPLLAEIML
ncbi:MAG: SHOCT domain-containing protein [Oscillospiraceae bacterium]|jgi:hypothetical protein